MKTVTYLQIMNLSVVLPVAQGTGWLYLDDDADREDNRIDSGWWDNYLHARRN